MNEKKIILIGLMGSGKSSVAKMVADKLSISAFDTDEWIENKSGKTIADIFKTKGENYFRELEGNALNELIPISKTCIVATGGGLPCYFDRMDMLNQSGITIYLKCSPEIIFDRIKNEIEKRPLIEKGTKTDSIDFIRKKLNERETIYESANYIIDANSSLEEVANKIINLIKPLVEE